MYEDAYSDFTYVIGHCAQKQEAYYERLFLNYEISNYYEAITDANVILSWDEENFEVKRIKILSQAGVEFFLSGFVSVEGKEKWKNSLPILLPA